jgi:hypothetical protein
MSSIFSAGTPFAVRFRVNAFERTTMRSASRYARRSSALAHARQDIVDLSPCRIAASTSFPVVSQESA